MKIFFDNVDFTSSSGPNSFGSKLANVFLSRQHKITAENPDIQLSFIQTINRFAPCVLRLDGIYFNSEQDWGALNKPLRHSYDAAEAVVVQSLFDKRLIEKYFGKHENAHVIRNGTCLNAIKIIEPAIVKNFDRDRIWCCASSWRPHKRLNENIEYFYEHASKDAVLLIAGNNTPDDISDERICKLGNLSWQQLISVMKASSHFVHLAWLDHCPNVVVDARAAGCHIICSSSGGTEEIAGTDATVIEEPVWDLEPIPLYKPPVLDYSKCRTGLNYADTIDIEDVATQYLKVMDLTLN